MTVKRKAPAPPIEAQGRPIVMERINNEHSAYQAMHCVREFLNRRPDDFTEKKFGMKHGAIITFPDSDVSFGVYQSKSYIKVIRKT